MARGFSATLGAGTTDRVTSATTLTAVATQSWHGLLYRQGDGGGGNGRMFVNDGSSEVYTDAGGTMQFFFLCSGGSGAGIWTCPRPAATSWHGVGVSMDAGSVANDPLMYVDGVSQTVTETLAPVGTFTNPNGVLYVGNRSDSTRAWDGMIAEFGRWNRVLTADEFRALGQGESPRSFPYQLLEYFDFVRPNMGYKLGAPTLVGTAVQPHPRVHTRRPLLMARRQALAPAAPALVYRPMQA